MALASDLEGQLLRQVLVAGGGIRPVLDSYNDFLVNGIAKILSHFPLRTIDGNYVLFSDPVCVQPTIHDLKEKSGEVRPLYPMEARRKKINYMGQLLAKIQLYRNVEGRLVPIEGESQTVYLGKIPVLIHSALDRLSNLTEEDRVQLADEPMGEPGGYFIIKGGEKVLLNIEKLRTLSPLLYEEKEKYMVNYTSQTLTETSIVRIIEEDNDVHVSFSKIGITTHSVNIFHLFYMLGLAPQTVESVYELVDTFIVDTDPQREKRRRQDARYYLKSTENSFLQENDERKIFEIFISKYSDTKITGANSSDRNTLLLDSIRREVFKNIPYVYNNAKEQKAVLWDKIRLLAYMVAKYVEFRTGYRHPDDRDSWGNKKLVDVGGHLEARFVHIWKNLSDNIQDMIISNKLTTAEQIKSKISPNYMTEQFIQSFGKDVWGGGRGTRLVVIVDVLKRDTRLAMLSHPRRISTPVNRQNRIREKRLIQNTGYGFVCPVMTPEGESCGLVKDQAITAYVSLPRDENLVKSKIQGMYLLIPKGEDKYSIFLNGVHLGYGQSEKVWQHLLALRRSRAIPFDTGLILNEYRELWVYTNAGRLCRPLLIVDPNTQELVIDQKKLRGEDLQTIMKNGALEYVDAAEQEQQQIYLAETSRALREKRDRLFHTQQRYEELLKNPQTPKEELEAALQAITNLKNERSYTHCEIDPTAILGISASIIPFPEFMPGPRGTYQASMGKQALGPNSLNIDRRFDTTIKTMLMPGIPILATNAHEVLGLDQFPAGRQVIVAITTYGGANQEDALIFNKGAIDRGLFGLMIYHSYETTVCQKSYAKEVVRIPENIKGKEHLYENLDKTTGIVRVGRYVRRGDILVSKLTIDTATGKVRDTSLVVDSQHKEGFVDEVYDTENAESCRLIRIRVRDFRDLEVGDKLASRYSQKGTIGDILPEVDMPFISSPNKALNGLRPSVIFNPHGIPSRMTVGKLIEILTGNVAVMTGERINATAFRRFSERPQEGEAPRFNLPDLIDQMQKLGFTRSGKYKMYNGQTGRMMDAEIFIGPVYYQVLRHLVRDKMQARATGAVQFMTRQPTSGFRNEGGLRLGEMERDAMIEHGAAYLLQERMVISSDAYNAIICTQCGEWAISSLERATIYCKQCGDSRIVRTVIPYAFKLLRSLASAAGYKIKLITKQT